MKKMKIEIWSDIACPYCYIGKRKLEHALDAFPHKDEIELVWHSYELNPNLPKKASGKSFYQFFADAHNMTIEEAKEEFKNITELAKTVNLDYHFEKLVLANTSDSLRLIKLAAQEGKATEAEEILFDAYFVEGKDISDNATLISLGTQIGLKEDNIFNMLQGDTFYDEIKKDMEYSENELNLEYIPFYLFNSKHIIQGSINTEGYLSILNKAYDEWKTGASTKTQGDTISGKSCSIDGTCSL